MDIGLVDRVVLMYDHCFWDNSTDWFNYVSTDPGYFPKIFNIYKYTNKTMLMFILGEEKAK